MPNLSFLQTDTTEFYTSGSYLSFGSPSFFLPKGIYNLDSIFVYATRSSWDCGPVGLRFTLANGTSFMSNNTYASFGGKLDFDFSGVQFDSTDKVKFEFVHIDSGNTIELILNAGGSWNEHDPAYNPLEGCDPIGNGNSGFDINMGLNATAVPEPAYAFFMIPFLLCSIRRKLRGYVLQKGSGDWA